MKNFIKKGIVLTLAVIILLSSSNIQSFAATTNEKITIALYVELLVKAAKLKIDKFKKQPYIKAALDAKIIKKGEFSSYKKNITREDTAVLTRRTYELIYGTECDEKFYAQVKDKKRLSDLKTVDINKIGSVRRCFIYGLMEGYSNGNYTQSRAFKGQDLLLLSDAKRIVSRINDPSKRYKLSPDGQVIRTTNLPKNYKDYEYILASFPNKFYEMLFLYEKKVYVNDKPYTNKEGIDYWTPKTYRKKEKYGDYDYKWVFEQYLDTWMKKVETNLNTRINVDYKTVDKNWINTLRNTYYVFDDGTDVGQTKRIENYVKNIKSNKLIVKGIAVVEPSTMYYYDGIWVRAFVQFTITSAESLNIEHKNIIYSEGLTGFGNLKQGVLVKGYYDIRLGTSTWGLDGRDLAVVGDTLNVTQIEFR